MAPHKRTAASRTGVPGRRARDLPLVDLGGQMSHQQAAKHGPAVDDALTNPRRQSSAGTHHRERPEDDPTQQTVADDVELRSELARFLAPSAFPANIDELRELAARHHATA